MLDSNSRLRAQMLSQFAQYQSSTIHYQFADMGQKVMLCFHGYDEHGGSYELPSKFVPGHYSMISFDLPGHGKTEWKETKDFDAATLWEIIDIICEKHGKQKDDCVLSGFSLGGRIALSLFSHRPHAVDKLLLFAPDGLTNYNWYGFLTRTFIGRGLFRFTVKYPGWLLALIRLGKKLKLLSPSASKFSLYFLQEKSGRLLLFERWMVTRKLSVAPSTLSKQIKESGTTTILVYGSYDRIVRPGTGHRFCRRTGDRCHVFEIPCGHQVFHEKNRLHLAEILIGSLAGGNHNLT